MVKCLHYLSERMKLTLETEPRNTPLEHLNTIMMLKTLNSEDVNEKGKKITRRVSLMLKAQQLLTRHKNRELPFDVNHSCVKMVKQ